MIVGFPVNKTHVNTRLQTEMPADLEKWLLTGATIPDIARLEAAKTDTQAIRNSIHGLDNLDLLDLAKNLQHPCLLVHGQNDQAITIPNGEIIDNMPDLSHLIVFEESGHYPMLTETNKFNRLLNDFLALESGKSPSDLQLKEEWKRRVR
ncbi:MAG: alpha/beta hydrolase [Anaerolineae bacterium]|nr:alpha/beta hydrolase [Anaerolineae bacterium]